MVFTSMFFSPRALFNLFVTSAIKGGQAYPTGSNVGILFLLASSPLQRFVACAIFAGKSFGALIFPIHSRSVGISDLSPYGWWCDIVAAIFLNFHREANLWMMLPSLVTIFMKVPVFGPLSTRLVWSSPQTL